MSHHDRSRLFTTKRRNERSTRIRVSGPALEGDTIGLSPNALRSLQSGVEVRYITLYCITLHYTTLHCITLHYIALHYITLHYIALHCIAL